MELFRIAIISTACFPHKKSPPVSNVEVHLTRCLFFVVYHEGILPHRPVLTFILSCIQLFFLPYSLNVGYHSTRRKRADTNPKLMNISQVILYSSAGYRVVIGRLVWTERSSSSERRILLHSTKITHLFNHLRNFGQGKIHNRMMQGVRQLSAGFQLPSSEETILKKKSNRVLPEIEGLVRISAMPFL